jgi:hypothetical protein
MQSSPLSFPLSSKFGERKKQIPLYLSLEKGEIKTKNFFNFPSPFDGRGIRGEGDLRI